MKINIFAFIRDNNIRSDGIWNKNMSALHKEDICGLTMQFMWIDTVDRKMDVHTPTHTPYMISCDLYFFLFCLQCYAVQ